MILVSFYYFGYRLDYSGIALLIMGSFVPPLYYGFYCSRTLKIAYMSVICSLGVICTIVSLWSKFNTPKYRVLRAGRGAFFPFLFNFSGSSKMEGVEVFAFTSVFSYYCTPIVLLTLKLQLSVHSLWIPKLPAFVHMEEDLIKFEQIVSNFVMFQWY